MRPACSEAEFVETFAINGAAKTARILGITERKVHERRRAIEDRTGRPILAPAQNTRPNIQHTGRIVHDIQDGVVLVGSDAHYWPGVVTTAHRAFVQFCKELRPAVVVMNGDVFDGASNSRWPAGSWEDIAKRPTVVQELEACAERLGEIETAAFKARKIWDLGNHDARFEMRLVERAPEYAKVHGTSLKDHFPSWEPCWDVWLNDDVVIKHRFKGGIHAVHNNAKDSGKTMVTGHLHSLKVAPWTDYNGTRWGVDTGTLADTYGPQFGYLENNPRSWVSGFVVLTFRNGKLMWPELCRVVEEGRVDFRGELISV